MMVELKRQGDEIKRKRRATKTERSAFYGRLPSAFFLSSKDLAPWEKKKKTF